MLRNHHTVPRPNVQVLAGGVLIVAPAPLHFTVATSRRRDGSLRIRVTRTGAEL